MVTIDHVLLLTNNTGQVKLPPCRHFFVEEAEHVSDPHDNALYITTLVSHVSVNATARAHASPRRSLSSVDSDWFRWTGFHLPVLLCSSYLNVNPYRNNDSKTPRDYHSPENGTHR